MRFSKLLFFIITSITFIGNIRAEEGRILCLESNQKTGAIKIQFNLPNDNHTNGSVQYKGGKGKITVQRYDEKVISPKTYMTATVKSSWKEFVDGKKMGTYILLTTGGRVEELTYINKNKTKIYKFYEDSNPYGDTQCWESN